MMRQIERRLPPRAASAGSSRPMARRTVRARARHVRERLDEAESHGEPVTAASTGISECGDANSSRRAAPASPRCGRSCKRKPCRAAAVRASRSSNARCRRNMSTPVSSAIRRSSTNGPQRRTIDSSVRARASSPSRASSPAPCAAPGTRRRGARRSCLASPAPPREHAEGVAGGCGVDRRTTRAVADRQRHQYGPESARACVAEVKRWAYAVNLQFPHLFVQERGAR